MNWHEIILYPNSYEILKLEMKMLKPSPGTLESYLPRKQLCPMSVRETLEKGVNFVKL